MTSWTGYLRSDGSKGIRDWILVVHTVECARFVAEKIASGEENVCCIGYEPCNDNDYAIRLLLALSRHPNAGGALFVGLGCEYTQPGRLAEVTAASGRPADWFFIQDVGGTTTAVAEGKRRLAALNERESSDRPLEAASCFGEILRALFRQGFLCLGREDPDSDPTPHLLEEAAWALGRWVYLLDAIHDLEADRKAGSRNPFAGLPAEEARRLAAPLLIEAEERVDRHLALLTYERFGELVYNIVVVGMPATRNRVLSGERLPPL